MLSIICHGRYEMLKAGVHSVALSVAALCAVYNFAAWVGRRQRHSWVNALVYGALTAWEVHHVLHHLNCRVVPIAPPSDAKRAA